MNNKEIYNVIKYICDERKIKDNADGCTGCAFINTEEWDMPCAKCKRNCKDYWRASRNADTREDKENVEL